MWQLVPLLLTLLVADPRLENVPRPDLEAVEKGVRERIEASRDALDLLVSRVETDPISLAEAFGETGRLYAFAELSIPAEACLRNASRLAPEDIRWTYHLGMIAAQERRLEEASARFSEVLKLRPENLSAILRRAEVLRLSDLREEARRDFERALKLDPQSAFATYGLARLAVTDGDWQRAAELFETTLALQPEADAVRQSLALAWRELGRRDAAREELDKAGTTPVVLDDSLLTAPREARSYAWSAMVASRQGDIDRAVELYRKAVADAPEKISQRLSLAAALLQAGQFSEALREYERALEVDPSHAIAHLRLAETSVQLFLGLLGDGEKRGDAEFLRRSLHHFERAARLAPDHRPAQLGLARALAQSGNHQDAIAFYERAIEMDPQDRKARVQLARSLARTGKSARAAELLEEVVTVDPAATTARLDLARIRTRLGDHQSALRHFEAALTLELQPGQRFIALFSAASLRQQRGDHAAAIPLYRAALDLAPETVDARFNLATALLHTGNGAAAIPELEAVLRAKPGDTSARVAMARALAAAGRMADAARVQRELIETAQEAGASAEVLERLRTQLRRWEGGGS